jgi:hypothetical protein
MRLIRLCDIVPRTVIAIIVPSDFDIALCCARMPIDTFASCESCDVHDAIGEK